MTEASLILQHTNPTASEVEHENKPAGHVTHQYQLICSSLSSLVSLYLSATNTSSIAYTALTLHALQTVHEDELRQLPSCPADVIWSQSLCISNRAAEPRYQPMIAGLSCQS